MPIDNDVYNRVGTTWWDEDNPLNMLHGSLTPGRFAYFHEVLTTRIGCDLTGLDAVDIGSGGGFLAEEFARVGCRVVGVDPSAVSVDAARSHAAAGDLDIDYRVGVGERLPFPDNAFDLAYCCDVLEHVTDVDVVVGEVARVLRPGGLFLFDTINRTRTSRLVAIKMMQEWRLTRLFDTAVHDWSMCIRPTELAQAMSRRGLHTGAIVGLGPRSKNPLRVFDMMRAARGRLSWGEVSRRLDFGRTRTTAISYMGYAVKS
ncbi:bifunctional 2-polyprenyl-6-hydroxyphenol methylase/3-demethylubiquinol 3-O-methyltransferase UbiG [Rhodococcus gannanensis]|uniref:Bifunctional 2-polyprenyl-6-hydroxyphenol methylase/3-demethylubiquinol 3-O-methyltransferase UbiG n=1 Tax=Rhodococcus gannanensis TaxID=1960308 RepID=A0ABW4PAT2_9NOCA